MHDGPELGRQNSRPRRSRRIGPHLHFHDDLDRTRQHIIGGVHDWRANCWTEVGCRRRASCRWSRDVTSRPRPSSNPFGLVQPAMTSVAFSVGRSVGSGGLWYLGPAPIVHTLPKRKKERKANVHPLQPARRPPICMLMPLPSPHVHRISVDKKRQQQQQQQQDQQQQSPHLQ
ncbi:hypothetical protein K431DRAFT_55900 [Polychaeton citri CBS 116435]|uniref:Uncharacterized protein n=1 Tax=Polychaeton citri CBS 116435 TaxID=1314669 RepID=A0A9P4QJC0_9PEZI|nr:hypothetical protein K431DRAFT_55900 [Polychaeton citri CBS 116435]